MFMFSRDKKDLLRALHFMQVRHCGYHNLDKPNESVRCDCKFGINEKRQSEQSGCPELMVAHEILAALTDTEWERALKRLRTGKVVINRDGTIKKAKKRNVR